MQISRGSIAERARRAGDRAPAPGLPGNLRLGELVARTVRQAEKDRLAVYAGNVAFRALFALFPALIALLWLLSLLGAERLLTTLLDLARTVMPRSAADPIRQQLTGAPADQASGSFTPWALLSLIIALWAGSSAVRAIMDAMNAMYAVEERRPALTRYGLSFVLLAAVGALLLGALALVVGARAITERIGEATGAGVIVGWAWVVAGWPVAALAVLAAFGLLYYVAPDVEQRMRWLCRGTVLAALLWLAFAALFSLYLNVFARPDQVYGALAGIVALMAYAYGSSFILLLGAELNQIAEMRDPDGKDEGEKRPHDGGAAARTSV